MAGGKRQKGAEAARAYERLLEIGLGGMGKVYLGRATGMSGFSRYVAIKQCHAHLTGDQEFAAMFLDEARLAARIHHPNVVPTLDVGESDSLYLVMEYVEGERLSQLIKASIAAGDVVPVDVALRIVLDGLAGLHAAHELVDPEGAPLHIVHRDATPQNIIVGVDGVARILDFGVAKAASQSTTTKDGHIKGKLGYMPPEQLNSKPITRQVDVYSMGIVLWELLAHERLFKGRTETETLARVLRGEVPSLTARRADVPEIIDRIIARAAHREPELRYRTALEYADALEAAGLPVASHRVVGAWVERLVGPALAARREALRALERGGASGVPVDGGDVSADGATVPSLPRAAGRWSLWAAGIVVGLSVLAWWWADGTRHGSDGGSTDDPPVQAKVDAGRGGDAPVGEEVPGRPVLVPARDAGDGADKVPAPTDAGVAIESGRARRGSKRGAKVRGGGKAPGSAGAEYWPPRL